MVVFVVFVCVCVVGCVCVLLCVCCVVGGVVVVGGVASDEAVAVAAAGTSAKATALWRLVAAKEQETEKDETDAAEEAAAY